MGGTLMAEMLQQADGVARSVYVLSRAPAADDRAVVVCEALRGRLATATEVPRDLDAHTVVVVEEEGAVRELVAAVRRGAPPPSLVVGWALPEHATAQLLAEHLPVVDSAVLADPKSALEHLARGWSEEELAEELAVAEALGALEEHVADDHEEDGR